MSSAGRFVVIGMFVVAVAATGASYLYHRNTTGRSLEFWGPAAANLIVRAPQVEILRLRPDSGDQAGPSTLTHRGQVLKILQQVDASQVPGLTHARRALVEDANLDWGPDAANPETSQDGQWDWALRFTNENSSQVLLLDFQRQRAALLDRSESVSFAPIAVALEKIVFAQIPEK